MTSSSYLFSLLLYTLRDAILFLPFPMLYLYNHLKNQTPLSRMNFRLVCGINSAVVLFLSFQIWLRLGYNPGNPTLSALVYGFINYFLTTRLYEQYHEEN